MSKRLEDPNANATPLDAESLFAVRGKTALVTGGSMGIGLMISKGLVANGCHVFICSNAGVTWGAPFDEFPDSAWEKVMNVNVRHVFNLVQKLAPILELSAKQGDPSRVITIASVDGVRATQTYGPTAAFSYTVSKGAVIHMTNALCRALSSRNITVNCIAPGLFPSQMTK